MCVRVNIEATATKPSKETVSAFRVYAFVELHTEPPVDDPDGEVDMPEEFPDVFRVH
jgi:hypothetical protein